MGIGNKANKLRLFTANGKFGYGGSSSDNGVSTNYVTLVNKVEPGKWYSVAMTYQENGGNGSVVIYVNGEKKAAVNNVGCKLSDVSDLAAYLGCGRNTSYILAGLYDGIQVAQGVVPEADLLQLTAQRKEEKDPNPKPEKLETVYVGGESANDNNTGADAANAVKTLKRALELAETNEAKQIMVCGTVEVTGQVILDSGLTFTRDPSFTGMSAMFQLRGSGAQLTLNNVTLDGNKNHINYPENSTNMELVLLTQGTSLNMNDGAVLTNNAYSAVRTVGNLSAESITINMTGGKIHNNETPSYGNGGGGVAIEAGGTTTLGGGIVKENQAKFGGGFLWCQLI